MSRSWRRWLVAALAIVFAVIAVPAAAVIAWWAYTSATVVSTMPIDGGALVSADGRTVSVTAPALCDDTDNLSAAERPDRVTLTLDYTHPRSPTCSGMPGYAVYRARLQAPLGRRALVDSATGKLVPYCVASRLPRPAYLPAGYALRYDAPTAHGLVYGDYLAVPIQATVSCSELYAAADPYDDLLVITQARGGRLSWPTGIKPQRLVVRGHPALAIPGRISWTEDGQLIVVATTNPALHPRELIAVADSIPARFLGAFKAPSGLVAIPAESRSFLTAAMPPRRVSEPGERSENSEESTTC